MNDSELTEEQRMIRAGVRALAEEHFKPKAAEVDRTRRPPVENIHLLAQHGYSGLFIPEEYGGPGLDLLDTVIVFEEIARCCANTAILAGSTDGATPRAIGHLGSREHRQRYLPRIVRGEILCAWGMSEANAGSDIGNIQCKARREGDEYVIDGAKLWCSGAQVADLFLVLVRLDAARGLDGVGAVLVEKGAPGFSVGKHLELIGFRGTGMAELVFEGCRVPADNLLVPAGGMNKLLQVFNADRIASNPSICLGVAQAAFEEATRYVKDRVQFGKPLSALQGVQWRLAEMAIDLEAGRSLLYRAARRVDLGASSAMDASIAKTYCNEMSRRVTDGAMQLFGAFGLSEEFPMERMFRDVRGMSVGYGTTEIHRNLIAREVLDGRLG